MDFDAAAEALRLILEPRRLAWMLAGTGLGVTVGLVPGLGGTVGMSILLPIAVGTGDPVTGVAMLIGMVAVVHTADTFPSVLLGIPGSGGSQATIMDGYPMAQRGEGHRALAAAFIVSGIGGLVGAVALFGVLGVARPLVLALRSPELFMLSLLGLSMVGVLSAGSPVRGLASGLLGLLMGSIGGAPGVLQYRYTFDHLYLYDGLPLAVLALGLFGIPEVVDLLAQRRSVTGVAQLRAMRTQYLQALHDVIKNKMLIVRNSLLGVGVGIIPGLGGAVVDWLAYGVTKQTSRPGGIPFGEGDVRGVIGPESANNAKEGGALVPALLFGIPGSGSTAILLGGLIVMGVGVGPGMVGDDIAITYSIIWTLALANVVGVCVCFLMSGAIARLTAVPSQKLAPFLLVVMTTGAYQSSQHWGDIIFLVVIGGLGWGMKHSGWARPPMLIGFVLSVPTERYLHLSMSRYGFAWVQFPSVIILGLVILTLLALSLVRRHKSQNRSAAIKG